MDSFSKTVTGAARFSVNAPVNVIITRPAHSFPMDSGAPSLTSKEAIWKIRWTIS